MANAKKATGANTKEAERQMTAAEMTAKDVADRKLAGLACMENYREKLKQEKLNRITEARRQREAARLAAIEAEKAQHRSEVERRMEEERAAVAARNAEADDVLLRTALDSDLEPEPAPEVAPAVPEKKPEPKAEECAPKLSDLFRSDDEGPDENADAPEKEESDEDTDEACGIDDEATLYAYQMAAAGWLAERAALAKRSERAEIDRIEDRIRAAEERKLRNRLEEREAALIARIEALENAAAEPAAVPAESEPSEMTELLRSCLDRMNGEKEEVPEPVVAMPTEDEPEIRIDAEVPDERFITESELLRATVIPPEEPEDDWIEIDCPGEYFAVPGVAAEFATKKEIRGFLDEKRRDLRELKKEKRSHKKAVRKTFLYERTDHWFGVMIAQRKIVEGLCEMLDASVNGRYKKYKWDLKSDLQDAVGDYNRLAKKCSYATKVMLTPMDKRMASRIMHGRDYETPRMICRRSQIDSLFASDEPSAPIPEADAGILSDTVTSKAV